MIIFHEKSEETRINFVNRTKRNYSVTCDDFTFIMVLVYHWDEKIRYIKMKLNLLILVLSMSSGFSLYHINSLAARLVVEGTCYSQKNNSCTPCVPMLLLCFCVTF